ncbi:hypothetical protein EVAR_72947_1 [Eumeta japonica]|uniref:Uncharacterized protein n=1 Tax=Eumeta variegata TaxID=151549 RepID=A0A4C1TEH7_EUMVA|nr:hypothetical protein EVAR_72947_1 [Eumeta japonica]
MNSMYKDFVREGTMKKSQSSINKTPPPAEIKLEIAGNEEADVIIEPKTPTNSLKRTASEAFAIDDEIVKLETQEEIIVTNETIKDEVIETQTSTASKRAEHWL